MIGQKIIHVYQIDQRIYVGKSNKSQLHIPPIQAQAGEKRFRQVHLTVLTRWIMMQTMQTKTKTETETKMKTKTETEVHHQSSISADDNYYKVLSNFEDDFKLSDYKNEDPLGVSYNDSTAADGTGSNGDDHGYMTRQHNQGRESNLQEGKISCMINQNVKGGNDKENNDVIVKPKN